MSRRDLNCPECGAVVESYRNPAPTVDMIIHDPEHGVVLVKRGRPPYGYALPGGFIEEGETSEHAAIREAKEETGLDITLDGLLGVYSDPNRDPRRHTLSVVYTAHTSFPERLHAGDDAAEAAFFPLDALPELAFDHAIILEDFQAVLRGERNTAACGSR